MNHNQQSGDGMHDDDAALSDFLASLMDYTPTIPDELVEHYLAKSGFQCPDVRLIRLVAVATQKFVAEVATDALQGIQAVQSETAAVVKDKRDKQQKDKRLILTMEDLSRALREYLILKIVHRNCHLKIFAVCMKGIFHVEDDCHYICGRFISCYLSEREQSMIVIDFRLYWFALQSERWFSDEEILDGGNFGVLELVKK
ncbi:Transcription initiation factor TFIID subunit 10 [Morella rubra]|uniref:Transcription initiation factor TFIID subunit 10 n=1 Tax=Morella rubra TaxID=262757 RepID=A0A6A1W3U7_9ROSI|nr:Transcription initiation factor TFIID subunit 10 [Morella rubra]